MSLNPRVCKKSYKVHIPMMGEACEFWLITVTDEQSITNPDKDHAYLTDDGKLFVFNGDSLVRVNCDICFTQEEREKLEGIEEGANKYVLPVASSTELGGVLLGYTQNGRNYPITKDTKGNIYVNVPWEEYQLPKATDNALGGIKTGYKQNGKFYPIKTDTDGNAYVQVPWEDTNTVYEVVSKTSNGLMPMLPSDENASKRFLNGDGEWVVGTDNSINGVTQTGSTFSGETSDCGVQILEVQGKTSQKTTNGYQLFDSSKFETKTSGGATVTNNNDGSFTVSGSGTLTATFGLSFTLSNEETKKLFKVGNLYLKDALSANQFYFEVQFKSASGNLYLKNNQTIELTEEIMSDVTTTILIYGVNGATIPNTTFKPMLYQDGDGTWEQYTGGKPAPNPDYAMPIENVEISEIESCGRNLLKLISTLEETTINGVTFEPIFEGGYLKCITVNGTSTKQATYVLQNKSKFKNKSYVLQGSPKSGSNSKICLLCGIYNQSGKWVGEKYDTGNGVTINVDNTLIEFAILVRENQVCNNLVFYPMLRNAEDLDTTYEPPKNAIVETSLTLAQDDIYQNGTITRDRKQVVFDGSSDEVWLTISNNRFKITVSNAANNGYNVAKGLCNRLKAMSLFEMGTTSEWGIISCHNNAIYVRINENVTTVEELRTWLSTHNLIVEYELAKPTTEEFKVPTIPSYDPYTEISTNSVVDPTITFKPLPYTTCLVGEATEEESGYMPPLSGNSNEFLNGSGEWSVPSGYTLPTASSTVLGGVKIGENITISSGTISIDKEDVTGALGYTPPTTNTTYSVATTSKDGLMSSGDKTKLTNLRRIWKGTSSSPPSGWVDGDIYVQYEE